MVENRETPVRTHSNGVGPVFNELFRAHVQRLPLLRRCNHTPVVLIDSVHTVLQALPLRFGQNYRLTKIRFGFLHLRTHNCVHLTTYFQVILNCNYYNFTDDRLAILVHQSVSAVILTLLTRAFPPPVLNDTCCYRGCWHFNCFFMSSHIRWSWQTLRCLFLHTLG